jgi:hypothetical protein
MASERRRHSSRAGERSSLPSVKLLLSLPEDELVAGELEIIQAHLAGLLDRVFPPDSKDHNGEDTPWP